jgi:hypothetical protein
MKTKLWIASGLFFGALAITFASVPAQAKNKTVKECETEWKAAEAAKTTGGKKRTEFIAACRKETATPAAAAPAPAPAAAAPEKPVAAAPAAKPAKPTTAGKKPLTPGQVAFHKREVECGQQWKADKAAHKVPVGMTWPKYLSACNKRLKSQGM